MIPYATTVIYVLRKKKINLNLQLKEEVPMLRDEIIAWVGVLGIVGILTYILIGG